MDRILNVLARYFDEDISKVLTQHLASRKVSIADAITLTHTDLLKLDVQNRDLLYPEKRLSVERFS